MHWRPIHGSIRCVEEQNPSRFRKLTDLCLQCFARSSTMCATRACPGRPSFSSSRRLQILKQASVCLGFCICTIQERLGVCGGSYGGFMTMWIATQTQRFKAAVSHAGLSNHISFYGTSMYLDLPTLPRLLRQLIAVVVVKMLSLDETLQIVEGRFCFSTGTQSSAKSIACNVCMPQVPAAV